MCHLHTVVRHGVTCVIEGQVHVLLEKALELGANEEGLGCSVLNNLLPDHLLLTVSTLSLVCCSVEVHNMRQVWALMGVIISVLLMDDVVMVRILMGMIRIGVHMSVFGVIKTFKRVNVRHNHLVTSRSMVRLRKMINLLMLIRLMSVVFSRFLNFRRGLLLLFLRLLLGAILVFLFLRVGLGSVGSL